MTLASATPLAARDLTLAYDARVVIDGLDLDVVANGITAIIGPNGCGKSTLLRALGRLLAPKNGQVLLDGRRIDALPTKQIARELGLLPQSPVAPDGLTVADLVARGRHPHRSWRHAWSAADSAAVDQAIERTGIGAIADRPLDELSGGQRQRAWIALTLAQETNVLLLDEPTTHLDIAHAVEVLDLVDRLHDEHGRTVVMVLHDLTLAARYADHLIVLHEGRVAAAGDPAAIVTAELVEAVFGIRAAVVVDPTSGRPLVIPIGERHVLP